MSKVTFCPDRIAITVDREFDPHGNQHYCTLDTDGIHFSGIGETADEADADLLAQLDDHIATAGNMWGVYTLDQVIILN